MCKVTENLSNRQITERKKEQKKLWKEKKKSKFLLLLLLLLCSIKKKRKRPPQQLWLKDIYLRATTPYTVSFIHILNIDTVKSMRKISFEKATILRHFKVDMTRAVDYSTFPFIFSVFCLLSSQFNILNIIYFPLFYLLLYFYFASIHLEHELKMIHVYVQRTHSFVQINQNRIKK